MAFPKYESYKDSGVEWLGEIPIHWEAKRNKYLFAVRDERKGKEEIEHFSLSKTSGLIPHAESTDKDARADSLENYKRFECNDLVMNKMQAWNGIFSYARSYGVVSPDYTVFKKINNINVRYYDFLYKTSLYVSQFLIESRGMGTAFLRLNTPKFAAIYAIYPPIEEQNRIVDFLDRITSDIDQAIAKKQRLIELLNEQKAILINRAVTKGLNPNVPMHDSGIDAIGEIPEHWGVSRISFIGKIGNGSTPNRSNASYWNNGSIPWLNSSKVNDIIIKSAEQFVTQKAVRECHLPLVKPNSIVVAITGEGKTRGNSAICKIETTINQHLAYIEILDKDILPEFLHLYLQGMYAWIRSSSSGNGSPKGAITCDDIKKYKIPVPLLEEQKSILNVTSNRIKDIEEVSQKTLEGIDKLNSLKQAPIQG